MQDAYAARPAFIVNFNEFLKAALKPGRHHATIRVPDGAEAIPQPCVAPHGPVFHEFADHDFIGGDVGHCGQTILSIVIASEAKAIQPLGNWIGLSLTLLAM